MCRGSRSLCSYRREPNSWRQPPYHPPLSPSSLFPFYYQSTNLIPQWDGCSAPVGGGGHEYPPPFVWASEGGPRRSLGGDAVLRDSARCAMPSSARPVCLCLPLSLSAGAFGGYYTTARSFCAGHTIGPRRRGLATTSRAHRITEEGIGRAAEEVYRCVSVPVAAANPHRLTHK